MKPTFSSIPAYWEITPTSDLASLLSPDLLLSVDREREDDLAAASSLDRTETETQTQTETPLPPRVLSPTPSIDESLMEYLSTDAAHLHVFASDHNTHAHLWWMSGNKRRSLSLSCGRIGYKGAKRGTTESAQALFRTLCPRIHEEGITAVHLYLKDMGNGRGVAPSLLEREGISVRSITDTTPEPHGGCRGKKLRRI